VQGTGRLIHRDAAGAGHIRMIVGCGRVVVPRQFRGPAVGSSAGPWFRGMREGNLPLTEHARNAIAGERADREVSTGQRPLSGCMDGRL
jgi:hypothetical protein